MISTYRKIIILLMALGVARFTAHAAIVDTVETYSPSMQKNIKAVVISPDNYSQLQALPVVYLLHGYGGSYSNLIKAIPSIKNYADEYHMILVCADSNISSWYIDSPVNTKSKYETYTSTELINWIDAHYNTIKNRSGRAITGNSMGGHGAFYLAFRHQDIYGAAGSMSGGVDIRPFPNNWKMSEVFGQYEANKQYWEDNTIVNMVKLLTPGKLSLIFDCGTADFFYQVNVNLHELLLANKIPHDFISRPGAHNAAYWSNAIKYQMLYFHDYFESKNKQ